jgi:hypothetical protein
MLARKKTTQGWARHLLPTSLIVLSAIALQGCQDGVSTETQPVTNNTPVSTYSGPAARTTDIQNFRVSLWEPLRAENRCGSCHGTGGQAPLIVRSDDVNLAYEATNPYINRTDPEDSALVTKVANGHNCWQASDSACASIITTYIENWVGTGATTGREIELEAPNDSVVGESKQFPDDSTLFATYVHPLLDQYCVECHIETATSPQSPYFAENNVDVAYAAVKTSIDLDTPSNSRLVQRLVELHNCWDDCPSNATEMENAITQMASGILPTPVDPALVVSRALTLPDGIVASGGSRHETDLIALYEFKTGSGNIAYDTSGVDPAINLTMSNSGVSWVKGWGLEFTTGKAQGVTGDSSKLSDLIKATGEYSIEAWVVPANVTQEGPARIISYSAGANDRNFTLGQTLYNYNFMHRSSTTDANGEPALSTADADEDLQASEQHVVITYDPANGGRSIYVNGIHTGDIDDTEAGNLSDWDDTYALVLGSEPSGEHQWAGKIRLLAVHNRALTQGQITQNFEAGVGEKYFLLFDVSSLVNLNQSYIMFEVSLFDNYSYRFRDARFISLDETVTPGTIPLEGMRIGINGKESAMGQAYDQLITTINGTDYTPNGQSLSRIGTTIPLERGEDSDQFFLTFERLGDHTHVFTEPAIPTPATPADNDPVSEIGLRTFEEIDASMSALTGVPRTNSAVTATYETIRQQLPSSEAINGFLSSHQVAVSQLAIEYCSELVDDTTLRASFFPGFNFSTNANDIADATWETGVVDPIIDTFLGQNIGTQPLPADVRAELLLLLTDTNDLKPYDNSGNSNPDGLPDGLARCGGACTSDRTTIVTKAACASVLGSATLLLQ